MGAQLLDPLDLLVEALAQAWQGRLAGFGQAQRPGLSVEQRHIEPLFKRLDLVADCYRRDVQLGWCSGEAEVAPNTSLSTFF